jgi:hypothetical protein
MNHHLHQPRVICIGVSELHSGDIKLWNSKASTQIESAWVCISPIEENYTMLIVDLAKWRVFPG